MTEVELLKCKNQSLQSQVSQTIGSHSISARIASRTQAHHPAENIHSLIFDGPDDVSFFYLEYGIGSWLLYSIKMRQLAAALSSAGGGRTFRTDKLPSQKSARGSPSSSFFLTPVTTYDDLSSQALRTSHVHAWPRPVRRALARVAHRCQLCRVPPPAPHPFDEDPRCRLWPWNDHGRPCAAHARGEGCRARIRRGGAGEGEGGGEGEEGGERRVGDGGCQRVGVSGGGV